MKLFNHTKLDDKFLKQVILEAAKSIGIAPKTRHVPVKVVAARNWQVSGVAYRGREVSLYFMNKRTGYRAKYDDYSEMIKADGIMLMRIPVFSSYRKPLELAEYVFAVIAHEWRHIRDCQRGLRFDSKKDVSYHNRCQEIRAKRSEKLAKINLHKSVSAQEAVLNLAINLEELAAEKERKVSASRSVVWESWKRRRVREEKAYEKTAHGKRTLFILNKIAKETREAYG